MERGNSLDRYCSEFLKQLRDLAELREISKTGIIPERHLNYTIVGYLKSYCNKSLNLFNEYIKEKNLFCAHSRLSIKYCHQLGVLTEKEYNHFDFLFEIKEYKYANEHYELVDYVTFFDTHEWKYEEPEFLIKIRKENENGINTLDVFKGKQGLGKSKIF